MLICSYSSCSTSIRFGQRYIIFEFIGIELSLANGVVLALAPQTNQRMQSLDTGLVEPLKKAHGVTCGNWQISNPGSTIIQFAWSFKSSGIWSFDGQLFTNEDWETIETQAVLLDFSRPSESGTVSSVQTAGFVFCLLRQQVLTFLKHRYHDRRHKHLFVEGIEGIHCTQKNSTS